jgi:hypothetical protein
LYFVPVVGGAADAANGVIHVARGNYVEAGFSFIAVVPIIGDAVAGGRKAVKAADKVGDLIKNGSNLDDGVKALNKVNEGVSQASRSQTKVDINIAQNKLASCFLAGTLVSKYSENNIEQKELVPIEQIKSGNKVWSYNRTKNSWEPRIVLDTYCREYVGDIVAINIDNKIIDATGGHPFWVLQGEDLEHRPICDCLPACDQKITPDGRWVYARDLRIDDVVRSHSFGTQKISALELSQTETLVYNFLVDDLHNYAVGIDEILVHNTNSPGKFDDFDTGYKPSNRAKQQDKTRGIRAGHVEESSQIQSIVNKFKLTEKERKAWHRIMEDMKAQSGKQYLDFKEMQEAAKQAKNMFD